ncbi:MAG TPA: hypothetical protein VHZ50_04690 [Puia sp.]|nr:hypothetical protein [Puia sp.]
MLKTDDTNETLFFLIKSIGTRLNLFYRFYYNDTGSGASYRSDVFMLEFPNKKMISVYGGLFSRWSKKIKIFLSADPALLSFFEKKVSSITDIPDFVKAANVL